MASRPVTDPEEEVDKQGPVVDEGDEADGDSDEYDSGEGDSVSFSLIAHSFVGGIGRRDGFFARSLVTTVSLLEGIVLSC